MYLIIANRSKEWITYNHKRMSPADGTIGERVITRYNSVVVPAANVPHEQELTKLIAMKKVDVFRMQKMVSFPFRFNTRVLLPISAEDIFPDLPEPETEPVVEDALPPAEFLKPSQTNYAHGTGIDGSHATSRTDGILTLALSPLNAYSSVIIPADGAYTANNGNVSVLFGVASTFALGSVMPLYEVVLSMTGPSVSETFTLTANRIVIDSTGLALTGTTVKKNTVQNVTRPVFFQEGDTSLPGEYTFSLTATHLETSTTTVATATVIVPGVEAPEDPEDPEEPEAPEEPEVPEDPEVPGDGENLEGSPEGFALRMTDGDEGEISTLEGIDTIDWEAELTEETSIARLRELGQLFDPPVTGKAKADLINGMLERLSE